MNSQDPRRNSNHFPRKVMPTQVSALAQANWTNPGPSEKRNLPALGDFAWNVAIRLMAQNEGATLAMVPKAAPPPRRLTARNFDHFPWS